MTTVEALQIRSRRVAMKFAVFLGGFVAVGIPMRAAENPVTFTRDVAPILFAQCAGCHRPGQAAPFPLLTYDDTRKHVRQIVDVTGRRYMPPWLPETGLLALEGERRLTDAQIATLRAWSEAGAPEGSAADLPAVPKWSDDWQLGKPDLVLTMPEPFNLPADGRDVYRNFVIAVPPGLRRFVRGIEFNPGNYRIVHHAFISIDTGGIARRLAGRDGHPGFDGIHSPTGVRPPDGYFLSWQPGKRAALYRDGYGWPLEPGSDLVIQAHLQPSGRPEKLQASVGLFFTDQAPTRRPYKIWLSSYQIDIPAGATNYVVRDQYQMSADADLLSLLPHAHYLGREMKGYVILPDGGRRELFHIPAWDFNWQGDYRFVEPVFLPKGATVHMEFHYDNSTNNVRNPHTPPQRVRFGPQSSEEMAELWLQLLPRTSEGRSSIENDYRSRAFRDSIEFNQYLLAANPNDAQAHRILGKTYFLGGQTTNAIQHLQESLRLDPNNDETHYYAGLLLRQQRQLAEAEKAFRKAIAVNPGNAKAHGNLGLVLLELGRIGDGEKELQEALRLDPRDALALDMLGLIQLQAGHPVEAGELFRRALEISPADPGFRQHLEQAQRAPRTSGK